MALLATSHGKTAADGVAGTLKRLATKASLQHPDGNQILNAKQLLEFAVREIKGISFCYVISNEHREEADLLRDRFDRSKTIPRTHKFHNFKPIDKLTIEVKNYSTSSKAYQKRVSKLKRRICNDIHHSRGILSTHLSHLLSL